MPERPIPEHGSMWGADATQHVVVLHRWKFDPTDAPGRSRERVEHWLSPADALELAERLTAAARRALGNTVADLRRGDCPTCRNLRLVEVAGPGGRPTQVYCPACRVDDDNTNRPLGPIPTLPGWVDHEAEVLDA